jgi:hypothetical protein
MLPVLMTDCVVCVAERHANGFLILGVTVLAMSVVGSLLLAWRDRTARASSRLHEGEREM